MAGGPLLYYSRVFHPLAGSHGVCVQVEDFHVAESDHAADGAVVGVGVGVPAPHDDDLPLARVEGHEAAGVAPAGRGHGRPLGALARGQVQEGRVGEDLGGGCKAEGNVYYT